jgi:hypothetical protein
MALHLLSLTAASDLGQSLLSLLAGTPRFFGSSNCLGNLWLLAFGKPPSFFSGFSVTLGLFT